MELSEKLDGIPEAAVEAAAKAIRESVQPTQASIIGPYATSEMQARASLEAANLALLGLVREQAAKLAKVEALVQEAFNKPVYILPGGYPSKPVEAFDLRAAMGDKA